MPNYHHKPEEIKCKNCASIEFKSVDVGKIQCEYCGTSYLFSGPTRMLIKQSLADRYDASVLSKFLTEGGMLPVESMDDIQIFLPGLVEVPAQ